MRLCALFLILCQAAHGQSWSYPTEPYKGWGQMSIESHTSRDGRRNDTQITGHLVYSPGRWMHGVYFHRLPLSNRGIFLPGSGACTGDCDDVSGGPTFRTDYLLAKNKRDFFYVGGGYQLFRSSPWRHRLTVGARWIHRRDVVTIQIASHIDVGLNHVRTGNEHSFSIPILTCLGREIGGCIRSGIHSSFEDTADQWSGSFGLSLFLRRRLVAIEMGLGFPALHGPKRDHKENHLYVSLSRAIQ